MTIKTLFYKLLNWYIDKTPLLSNTTVSYSDTQILVSKNTQTNYMFISDNSFHTISEDMLKKLLKTNFVQYVTYHAELFDCDDYSFEMCGQMKLLCPNIAFGLAQSNTHAFNIAILDTKEVVIIEPQTNQILKYADYKNNINYFPCRVVMI